MGKKWVTVALIGAVAIAGCGGSSSDDGDTVETTADVVDSAAFISKARAICVDVARAMDGRTHDISRVDGATAYTTERREAQKRALDELRALTPPSEAQSTFETLLTALDQRSFTMQPMQIQMIKQQRDASRRSMIAYNQQENQLRQLGQALGLPECYWG